MHGKGEADYLITHDGEEYSLRQMGCRALMGDGGRGMPPIEYTSRRGYAQHGNTVTAYRLQPRNISLQFYEVASSRDNYWNEKRKRLLDILRPNRALASNSPVPVVLRKILPLGQRRDILCYTDSTPAFESESALAQGITETLSLFCPDPVFYDPTVYSGSLATVANTQLVFPITFDANNIFFGSENQIGSVDILYPGSWLCWPTIVITGPYTTITIENETMGVAFTLAVPKGATETITVDLTPGAQTITDQNGNSCLTDLAAGNLVDWALAPHPMAAGGVNTIVATATGRLATTTVTIQYNMRYIGL